MKEHYDYFVQFFVRENASKEWLSGMVTCTQKGETTLVINRYYSEIMHRLSFASLKDFSHTIFCHSLN